MLARARGTAAPRASRSKSTGAAPSVEGRRAHHDLPCASITKEPPSNTSSSWPPTRLTLDHGQADVEHALAHDVLARALLAQLVGRGVDDQQDLGTLRARELRGLRLPDVLADQQTRGESRGSRSTVGCAPAVK
jgi:hypothetical protein